ncbi:MAG: hypothetical protein CL910_04600 [Deltaproteobacteria bacterium]|nr:hypothetical protein [Deltaproteobacteria bacterium]
MIARAGAPETGLRLTPRATVLLLALALAGCRTPGPPAEPLAIDGPVVAERLAELRALADRRHGLRAQARVSLEGARGASFARHLLLLERPARLRLEILGLMGQRVAVLASDGTAYDLYRAETGQVESGPVHPGLLGEVAGVPLAPGDLVTLLLGIPPRGLPEPTFATRGSDGRLALEWRFEDGAAQTALLDASGHLVALRLADAAGIEQVAAGYGDHAGPEDFAETVRLSFGPSGLRAEVAFAGVELDPDLAPGLFRLQLVSSPGG